MLTIIANALQMWRFNFFSSLIDGNLKKSAVIVGLSHKVSKMGLVNFIAFVVQKVLK